MTEQDRRAGTASREATRIVCIKRNHGVEDQARHRGVRSGQQQRLPEEGVHLRAASSQRIRPSQSLSLTNWTKTTKCRHRSQDLHLSHFHECILGRNPDQFPVYIGAANVDQTHLKTHQDSHRRKRNLSKAESVRPTVILLHSVQLDRSIGFFYVSVAIRLRSFLRSSGGGPYSFFPLIMHTELLQC